MALGPNVRTLGIRPGMADAIVLSYGHYDHTGGLAGVLRVVPGTPVYAHPDACKPKHAKNAACPVGTVLDLAE